MEIEKIKQARTEELGKEIVYYETIESTHIKAKELTKQNVKNGTVIIAEQQTGGIGTKGRKWHTGENNIAMTIIIYPKYQVDELKGITVEIAKSMKETIQELYGYKLQIKEPNDLMLNGKKISGILTQIATQKNNIKYLLISIGFNVNEKNFSEDTKEIATSLKKEYSKEFERESIIIKFLEILEGRIKL